VALADITNKILDDSREKAREIVAQAERDAEKIAVETKEEAASIEKASALSLDKILSQNKTRVIASAKQEGKHALDTTKRELLDSAFSKSFELFSQLPEKEYGEYIERLAKELPTDFSGDIIVPNKRNKETILALKKAGITKNISDDGTFTGGFIAKQKTFEYDATFEKLFADKKANLETEVASILFGEAEKD